MMIDDVEEIKRKLRSYSAEEIKMVYIS